MNIKQKFETAKAKFKAHAPEIIIAGAAVSALAYGIASTIKIMNQSGSWENSVPKPITGADREKILGDERFDLYRVEDDYYYLTPATLEN